MRTLPRQVLHESPLVHVLAQFVFQAPVYGVDRLLPEIQQTLQRSLFDEVVESTELRMAVDRSGEPRQPQTEPRWDFLRHERRQGVVLTRNALVFQTSAYSTFEDFIGEIGAFLPSILALLAVSRLQRVGLRYIDLVREPPTEPVENLVLPSMLGFPSTAETSLGAKRVFGRTDTLLQTVAGLLAVRSLDAHGVLLPPDLTATTLAYPSRPSADEHVLLLDFDHFRIDSIDAGWDETRELLWALHDSLDHAFRAVTTDVAMKHWGQTLSPEE